MTSKEFAFNYAGKEFIFYGDRVIVVGYDSEYPDAVIVSPASWNARGCFWEGLDNTDVITYRGKRKEYQYAQIEELGPVTEEKPKTPGECIAYFEGQQGMNYSVVNGCVSAVYKRQGGALKLVSRGDSINNVTEKI
nr:MAG TPA: hypothetical protein [Caudoviricetes sp.]